MTLHLLATSLIFSFGCSHSKINPSIDHPNHVSAANGNFFIFYDDALFSAEGVLPISRNYNNKASYDGLFGFGWGSLYASNLVDSKNGTITIHEYGNGGTNVFLIENSANRNGKARKKFLGKLYRSERYGNQTLTASKSGYVRVHENGGTESFDRNGKLRRIDRKSGGFIELLYDPKGFLSELKDEAGRKVLVKCDGKGRIIGLVSSEGREFRYSYDGNVLKKAQGFDGRSQQYKYDERLNLIDIRHDGSTQFNVEYYGKNDCDCVKKVRYADGYSKEYEYSDPCGKLAKNNVVEIEKDSAGKEVKRNVFSF